MKSILSERMETLETLLKDLPNSKKIIISDNTPMGSYGLIELIPTLGGLKYCLREIHLRGLGGARYFDIGQEDDLILASLALIEYVERPTIPAHMREKLAKYLENKQNPKISFHFLTEENMPFALKSAYCDPL